MNMRSFWVASRKMACHRERREICSNVYEKSVCILSIDLKPQSLSMVGAEAIATGGRNPGLDYDSGSGTLVAWNGGADVYTLDMATQTWTRVPPAPGKTVVPTNPVATSTYGRWRYSPRYNVFIVVNNVKPNVFAYRLAGSDLVPLPVKECPCAGLPESWHICFCKCILSSGAGEAAYAWSACLIVPCSGPSKNFPSTIFS